MHATSNRYICVCNKLTLKIKWIQKKLHFYVIKDFIDCGVRLVLHIVCSASRDLLCFNIKHISATEKKIWHFYCSNSYSSVMGRQMCGWMDTCQVIKFVTLHYPEYTHVFENKVSNGNMNFDRKNTREGLEHHFSSK